MILVSTGLGFFLNVVNSFLRAYKYLVSLSLFSKSTSIIIKVDYLLILFVLSTNILDLAFEGLLSAAHSLHLGLEQFVLLAQGLNLLLHLVHLDALSIRFRCFGGDIRVLRGVTNTLL
jgi:hypothetical protein